MSETIPLDAQDLTRSYGSVEALRGVSLPARAGEVTALIGDNGAGRSSWPNAVPERSGSASKPSTGI